MPLYEYKCPDCNVRETFDRTVENRNTPTRCMRCGLTKMKRVYSFSTHIFQTGYNPALGREVSSRRQLGDEAKRLSEAATERTGVLHDYQPVDLSDPVACGVTEAGLDQTERTATNTGQREAKIWL